jgi:nicotinamide riboside kinase
MKIALLGAESTGKTQLSQEIAGHYRRNGLRAEVVAEVLREWCAREGRTPRPEEQLPIAREQERRVDDAAARADVVIADTTAVMVAIYSAMLFKDGSLLRFAIERQRTYDVTLVTGLDIPWVADGLQRDGPHVREPIDAQVRQVLADARVPYRVVYGTGPHRVANALAAVDAGLREQAPARAWAWNCEKCSDPECEHRLFTGLLRT